MPRGKNALRFCFVSLPLALLACSHIDRQSHRWNDFVEQTQHSNGPHLYYQEFGKGEPLLLIHGFGASLYSWRYIIPALARHHRVIAIDLKGFGQSVKPDSEQYTVYDQVQLVYQLIKEKNLQNLTVIGHSFGGGVALVSSAYLAEHDPTRLQRLVLIDSSAYPQPKPWFMKIPSTPVIGPILTFLVPAETQVRKVLELAYHNDKLISENAVDTYASALKMPGGKYAAMMTAKQIPPSDIVDLVGKYSEIKVPTLILWGDDDKIVPLEIGERLHHEISNSKLTVLKSCGHVPQEEQPLATQEALERFLLDRPSTKPPSVNN